jgi:hypothetical protein
MATTIESEDSFDLAACPTIGAPTLILAGRDDRFYSRELLRKPPASSRTAACASSTAGDT